MSDFEKPGLIQRNVYEMEKKLQGESMKAVTKSQYKEPMQEPLVIIKKPLKIEFKGTPEFIGKLAMRDFELERKLMDDTYEALGITTEYFTPTEILTSVTPEMIEDQQIEETKPVKVGDQFYNYAPSNIKINLEEPTLIELKQTYTEEQLKQKERNAKKQYLEETTNIKDNLMKENRDELTNIEEKYNTETAKNNDLLSKDRVPGGRNNVEKRQSELTDAFNLRKNIIDREYKDLMDSLKNIEQEYNVTIEDIKQYREIVKDNEKEMIRVNRTNQDILKQYASDLLRLNPRLGRIEQGANETNEEFKTRLESVAVPISDEERKQRDGRLSFEQAKRNLKQFFTEPSRVEFLVKQIENRNEFNKMFTKIKTDYLARYGVDNKQIRNEEVIDYITEAIKQPNFLTSPPPGRPYIETGSQEPIQAVEAVLAPAEPAYKELKTYANSMGVSVTGKPKIQELLFRMNRKNVFVPDYIIDKFSREVDRKSAIDSNEQINLRNNERRAEEKAPKGLIEARRAEIVGSGVGVKNYPKFVKFGKVQILLDDLYYKNMLKIRLPNKRSIIGFPNKRISDIFVSIIMKLIEGNPITKTDLDFLKPAEKTMYDKLLVVSGLHKTVSNTYEETIEEMKQRLRLIEGQLKAGNDNTSILKEAHSILHGMSACGLISGNAASRYYKELKASQME